MLFSEAFPPSLQAVTLWGFKDTQMPIYHPFCLTEHVPVPGCLMSNNLFHTSSVFPCPSISLLLVSSSIAPTIHLTQVTSCSGKYTLAGLPFIGKKMRFYDLKEKCPFGRCGCSPWRLKHSWKYDFKVHVQHLEDSSQHKTFYSSTLLRCFIAGTTSPESSSLPNSSAV